MMTELKNNKRAAEIKRKLQSGAKKAAVTASLILTMVFGSEKDTKAKPESGAKESVRLEADIPVSEVLTISKTDCLFKEAAFAHRLAQNHSLEFFGNMFYVNDLIRATRAQGYKEQLIKAVADYVFKSGGLSGKSNYCVMSGALSAKRAAQSGEENSKIAALITKAVDRIFPDDSHSNVSCPKFLEHVKSDKILARFLYECKNNLQETINKVGVGGILISRVPGNRGVSTSSGMHFTCIGPKWVQERHQEHGSEIKSAIKIVKDKEKLNLGETLRQMRLLAPNITQTKADSLSEAIVYVGANGESSGRTELIAAQNSGYYFNYCGAVAYLIFEEMKKLSKEDLQALLKEQQPADRILADFQTLDNKSRPDMTLSPVRGGGR